MAYDYIKLPRYIIESACSKKPFNFLDCWVDLCLHANTEDETYDFYGTLIEVKCGELLTTTSELAQRWGLSDRQVRRYLKKLSDAFMTCPQKTHLMSAENSSDVRRNPDTCPQKTHLMSAEKPEIVRNFVRRKHNSIFLISTNYTDCSDYTCPQKCPQKNQDVSAENSSDVRRNPDTCPQKTHLMSAENSSDVRRTQTVVDYQEVSVGDYDEGSAPQHLKKVLPPITPHYQKGTFIVGKSMQNKDIKHYTEQTLLDDNILQDDSSKHYPEDTSTVDDILQDDSSKVSSSEISDTNSAEQEDTLNSTTKEEVKVEIENTSNNNIIGEQSAEERPKWSTDIFRQCQTYYNEAIVKYKSGMRKSRGGSGLITSLLNARIRENGIEVVKQVIDMAAQSSFLSGNNNRGWKACFEWILRPNNFPKILDGNYTNRTINTNQNATHQQRRLSEAEIRAFEYADILQQDYSEHQNSGSRIDENDDFPL